MVPSVEERAEYAACLIKMGASHEALNLLTKLDAREVAEIELYRAFALITQWRYQEAIPLLLSYSKNPIVGPFQQMVGRVNLAAAYVNEREFENSTPLLAELAKETRKNEFHQLHGNVLEIQAQAAIFQKDWTGGTRCLAQARKYLQSSKGLSLFFVDKWEAIQAILRNPKSESHQQGMIKIRKLAETMHHWETVRECDLYLSYSQNDETLLKHIFFGTPFESYRKKLIRGCPFPTLPFDSYLRTNDKRKKPTYVLRLQNGETSIPGVRLKAGQMIHRLFLSLASDFYRPLSVAYLHSQIYPEQFFNPRSSAAKIHELVKRGRRWIEHNDAPFSIFESHSEYSLRLHSRAGILCENRSVPKSKQTFVLNKIRSSYSTESFSAKDLASLLEVSSRTARRYLKEAENQKQVERVGNSSNTLFRLAS